MTIIRFHSNHEDLKGRLSMLKRKKNFNLMLSKLFLLFEPTKTALFLVVVFFNLIG